MAPSNPTSAHGLIAAKSAVVIAGVALVAGVASGVLLGRTIFAPELHALTVTERVVYVETRTPGGRDAPKTAAHSQSEAPGGVPDQASPAKKTAPGASDRVRTPEKKVEPAPTDELLAKERELIDTAR